MNIAKAEKRLFSGTTHWVIQGGVFVPFTAIIPGQAITYVLRRQFPKLAAEKIVVVSTQNGLKSYWIYDEDEFEGKGYWCFKNKDYVQRVFRRWLVFKRRFYQEIERLEKTDISRQPLKEFQRFYRLYLDEYSLPLITEYYSLGGDKFVRELKRKYAGYKRLDDDIIVFTQPPKLSFLQRLELDLLQLEKSLGQKRLPTRLAEFQRRRPEAYRDLERIQRRYFWVQFNYRDTVPLSLEYFYNKLLALTKMTSGKKNQRRQELRNYRLSLAKTQFKASRRTSLTSYEMRALKSVGWAGHWQDERKQANLIANYWCQKFIKLFAKELGYTVSEIWHLTPHELFRAYRGKKVLRPELQRRISGCAYITFVDGQEIMMSGRRYEACWRRIAGLNLPTQTTVFSGIAASPGRIRGRIRKIETPSIHGKNLRPGEILLTYMTRPDFVPLMHRAAGIITDEGGLTSHAAIIARELKIPCVVGTRFAMRVLKDGDMVEVDATKGIVRIIK
ncbi:MAG: PEP-utilizing enzyme [Patescibacteria group bacterium]|nr:PEP-utilizing enzyme [Patescibacteria group bacterium]